MNMITVDVLKAKTQFSFLLDKVEAGEEVVITRHGKAVARLLSESSTTSRNLENTISRLKEMRKKNTLGGLSWKELRDAARK